MEVLLAVPIQLRTLAQWARLRELFSASSQARRRKRKKRRKRRTLRTSSRSLCGRARRRQRQWHVSGFPGNVSPRAVFPSVVVRPAMLGIMAVMNQKDRTTLVVNLGSGVCRVGFTGYDAPRVVFPSVVVRPEMPCIVAGMDLKDSCSGVYKAGIAGYNALRAVFSSLVRRPMMLSIMAFMDQKDSGSVIYHAGLLVTMHLALCSLVCRPMMLDIMAVLNQKDSHVVVPMVRLLKTVESPQLQFHPGRRHLCHGAQAVSHGPDSLSDHRFSPVTVQDGRRPCLQVVQISLSWCRCRMVQTVRRTMVFPQFVLDKVIVVPVVRVERVPHVPSWRRLSCSHSCTRCGFRLEEQLIIALMT